MASQKPTRAQPEDLLIEACNMLRRGNLEVQSIEEMFGIDEFSDLYEWTVKARLLENKIIKTLNLVSS